MKAPINLTENPCQWAYQDEAGTIPCGPADAMEVVPKAPDGADNPSAYCMDDYFEVFMQEKESLKDSTVYKYRQLYTSFIRPDIGTYPVEGVTASQLELLITDLTGSSTSPITVAAVRGLLSSLFRSASRAGIVGKNPMLDVKTPKNRKKAQERSAFTEEELAALLTLSAATDLALIFNLSAWTGMRLGEVLALQWEDIDFVRGRIRVRHNLAYVAKQFALTDPKTATSLRSIPIAHIHLEELRQYRETGTYRARVGAADEQWKELVFLSRRGRPYTPSYVSHVMSNLVGKMKESGALSADYVYTFHSLRHTFATRCLMKGMKPKVLSVLLGHSSVETTLRIYTHVTEEDAREEMRSIGLL